MKNKVQVSSVLKKIFLLFITGCCWLLPQRLVAQIKKVDSPAIVKTNSSEAFKIRIRGTELMLQFPRTHFRSAFKLINSNGAVIKAVMIDEGMESAVVSLNGLPKGIYQCVLENRTQRFGKRIALQ